ncbi:MAG: crotonase/enoyl-CoA hydratase family protein [Myxococcota bacterium]|nr:crotonase/enoyl-CoA hydratase family protein [Myxococcota bacterium]
MTTPEFSTLEVELKDNIVTARLNRPDKANALNETLWYELGDLARWVDETPAARVLALLANGKHFTAGIDFSLMMTVVGKVAHLPDGHKQEALRKKILSLQDSFTQFERCRKPVIAAIDGSCIGGGIDLITACDIRYASSAATFCVKEVDLAIVADIGTLQRLPPIVGEGMARDLALTGRSFGADEALKMGLISRVLPDGPALEEAVLQAATSIAAKSPLTVRGVKQVMNYSRGRTVEEGLDHVATWNAAMLMSKDTQEAMSAMMEKRTPTFDD